MLAGAVPVAVLAVVFEFVFAGVQWLVTPAGLRGRA
jgi:ABC-type proline/glycine betaine transport system permease subunit